MARGRWRTTKSERRATGSRVNGRSHDGSDLDLVLRGPDLKEIPSGQLGDFEEARVWLWPGRLCRRGSGRGVVERRDPAGGESHDGWSGVRGRRRLAQAGSRRRLCVGVVSHVPTVDAAVPERDVRIAAFLAIGHPRRRSTWAGRGSAGRPCGVRIGWWRGGVGALKHPLILNVRCNCSPGVCISLKNP